MPPTEAKVKKTGKNYCKQRLADHYTTCKPDPEDPGERWATGVAISVHKSSTRYTSATTQVYVHQCCKNLDLDVHVYLTNSVAAVISCLVNL